MKRVAVALAAWALVLLPSAMVPVSLAVARTASLPTETAVRGCIIRFPSSGPVILDDGALNPPAGHVSRGCNSVSVNTTGELVIGTDALVPIISATAQADETLVWRGITAGMSVGNTQTRVRFYKTGYGALELDIAYEYDSLAGDYSNLFVTWFSHTSP